MNTKSKMVTLLALLLGMNASVLAYNNTYAVIIGINDYKDNIVVTDLIYSDKEALAFYRFLTSEKGGSVPVGNICLLTDSKASKSNVMYQAKALFSKAEKNDRVIFYFGGHGGEGGFAPYDFDGYFDSVLSYSDIKAIFRCAKCNSKLLFADACHSGGIKFDSNKSKNDGHKNNQTATKNLNIAIMTASKSDEYSWQTSALEMGVFTYYLIEGLGGAANRDGNGYITIQELYYYVYHKVMDKTREFGSLQTPQLFGKFDLRLIVAKT